MALDAYLRMTGQDIGEIKGSVIQPGREDSVMVIAYEHTLRVPIDLATGRPSGKTEHGELTITKDLDKSTPVIARALVSRELITDWELHFWQPSRTGQEVHFYTIKLQDARVTAIQREMLNNKIPENMQHKEREHISFSYRSIIETWEDGGITWDDSRW